MTISSSCGRGEPPSKRLKKLPSMRSSRWMILFAQKMQRDKDWPMIRRLVGSHYDQNQHAPNNATIQSWLMESRTQKQHEGGTGAASAQS